MIERVSTTIYFFSNFLKVYTLKVFAYSTIIAYFVNRSPRIAVICSPAFADAEEYFLLAHLIFRESEKYEK